jgi:hypothetical protein
MAPDCLTPDCITDEQWRIYQRVIADSKAAGIPFAVGGGIAMGVYTGMFRDTKDIDLYVVPEHREAIQAILSAAGLEDYYDQLPYDRGWIYRSIQGKVIVDIIWSMANYKAPVDERWITGGPQVEIRGEQLRVVPPEEMIWAKLYIMQRDRCDWPDVLNLIRAQADRLDWRHLLERLGPDAPILYANLGIFRWLCPEAAGSMPSWLIEHVSAVDCPGKGPEISRRRADLLDRRPWFNLLAE